MKASWVWTLVIAAQACVLFMAWKAYEYCNENYARLPDKIPAHFGFKGLPDRWVRTSRLSVYWPVGGIIFMQIIVAGPMIILPLVANEDVVEMALFGTGLSFILGWLFAGIARGVIDVALKRSATIWPYMGAQLIAVMVFSLGFTGYVFSRSRVPPSVQKVTFCEQIDKRMMPVRPADSFPAGTQFIYALVDWEDFNTKKEVIYRWYAPGGRLAHTGRMNFKTSKFHFHWKTWYRINPPYFEMRDFPIVGRWTLKIFMADKQLKTATFDITPGKNPNIGRE